MNGYRLSEVAERSGVVREVYTYGWDANGSPVEPEPEAIAKAHGTTPAQVEEFTQGHPVLVVERKRRIMVGHVDNGRALMAIAVASICKVPK